jgi:hypothetical protein
VDKREKKKVLVDKMLDKRGMRMRYFFLLFRKRKVLREGKWGERVVLE